MADTASAASGRNRRLALIASSRIICHPAIKTILARSREAGRWLHRLVERRNFASKTQLRRSVSIDQILGLY